jgi:branched-chain amino acid transport system substrate-binding protein
LSVGDAQGLPIEPMPRLLSLPFAVAVAAIFVLAAAVGCRPAPGVRIGFLGDVISELGIGGRNGAQLAVETLNARHGGGYELLVEDDRNDADAARAAVASFASRGAAFVVGPMTSAMAVAAVPEANRLGIVLISPTATTDSLSGKDDFFFRTAADAPAGARQLAHLLRDRGVRSMAVLMDVANGAYSTSFGHAAALEFQQLGGTAAEVGYQSGKSLEFADAMRRISDSAPGAVILVNSPSDAAIATQHLRRVAPGSVIAISPWGANVQFLQVGARATEGVIALQAVDIASPLPPMRDFVERYRARFGELPTTPAVQGYEAVMLGVAALDRGGAKSLRATLSVPGQWAGLDGDFSLDAYGDTRRALHLAVVREGRFEALAR